MMIKDLCCVDVLQTKAAKRQKEEEEGEKDELHTQQIQMITQATRTIERRITDLSPYFFFLIFFLQDRSINRSKLASMYTFKRIQKVFFF